MRWDFFHKGERTNYEEAVAAPARCWTFDLPDGTTIAEAMTHAYANGLPRGSARLGCIEIQNDRGVYSREDGKRIDVSTPRRADKVIFKTWEQIEVEDADSKLN